MELPEIESGLKLHDVWGILYRGKWILFSIVFIVATFGTVSSVLEKPTFQATALLMYNLESPYILPSKEISPSIPAVFTLRRNINTQMEIIKSEALVEKVFQKLNLYEHPSFKNNPYAYTAFAGLVAAREREDTNIMEISAVSSTPNAASKEAAEWANAVAESLIEYNLENRMELTRQIYSWLQKELKNLDKNYSTSQERLYQATEKLDLFIPEDQQSIVSSKLKQFSDMYTEVKAKRIETESNIKQIEDAKSKTEEDLFSLPFIQSNTNFSALGKYLTDLQIQRSKLLSQYTEKHPELVKIDTQIEQTKKAMKKIADDIIMSLNTDYEIQKRNESQLVDTIEHLRNESIDLSKKSIQLERLSQETASNKDLYELVLKRIKETDVLSTLQLNNMSILERAKPPLAPIRPRPFRTFIFSLGLGFFLGVATIFIRELLENTVKSIDDIEGYLKIQPLTLVPKFASSHRRGLAEAYQNVRTALVFARKTEESSLVLVTSAGPTEGKTTTVINLAKVLAKSGERTLVIDLDLRRPAVHKYLNVASNPGITNFLLEKSDFKSIIHPTDTPNLYVIPCGAVPPNPPAFFSTPHFKPLILQLKESFQWVLIDSPPILSVTDPMLLAPIVDHVILVIQHNKVEKTAIKRCINNIRSINGNILGAILNNVDIERQKYFYHSYYKYYYYYPSTKITDQSKVAGVKK